MVDGFREKQSIIDTLKLQYETTVTHLEAELTNSQMAVSKLEKEAAKSTSELRKEMDTVFDSLQREKIEREQVIQSLMTQLETASDYCAKLQYRLDEATSQMHSTTKKLQQSTDERLKQEHADSLTIKIMAERERELKAVSDSEVAKSLRALISQMALRRVPHVDDKLVRVMAAR